MTAAASRPRRVNADVLRELLPLEGRRVADVGCGDGALVRMMARAGARAVGVECSPAQIEMAKAAARADSETYLMAVGERLPFADASLDAIVFFNSLHHVPVPAQETALGEAVRVTRPGGHLYIAEPLAEGNNFELVRAVDDETEIRAAAYRAIRGALGGGTVTELTETVYVHPMMFTNYEAFRTRQLAIEPERRAALDRLDRSMRELFARLGRREDKGYAFDQPIRVNLLARA